MSYAIIRNEKYKRENLKGIYRHNERRNKNYSNKNINKDKSYLNYSLKTCNHSYEKEFELIREKYNLKGQIKTVSNIVCEYIITSDKEFFNNIGVDETKRYFETAYNFVCQYKDLSSKYILSAKVHMDEETPHMHLVFIPVVHTIDKKGNNIDKIACSEFWKEKDSYRMLQDALYNYMISNNFDLERGISSDRQHLSVAEYKEITNFNNSIKTLNEINLDVPDVPNLKDIKGLMFNRDEKIQKEIIEPKDKIINELILDNSKLHLELNKQVNLVNKAEKHEKEYSNLLKQKRNLEINIKELKREHKEEIQKINDIYIDKINSLENENNFLLYRKN